MLRYLFIDMNSYFASVEQQERPALRNRPVAVVPVLAETSCCIAASYEAKKYGVTTGTKVYEARRRCPDLHIIEARPPLYITVHRRIIQAVESCAHVERVCSIDEMVCKLKRDDRQSDHAVSLAQRIQRTLRRDVGDYFRCSIGIASNVLLAKVAADFEKPNGLTVFRPEELPDRLYALKLTDFPGIGPRMERQLHQHGITTVHQLYQLSQQRLSQIWGSKIVGHRWWHLLRGEDLPEPPTRTRSLGHSHVLPPELRHDAGARAVLAALIHKAAARLRKSGYWAGSMTIHVEFLGNDRWRATRRLDGCRDTLTFLRLFGTLWEGKPYGIPLKIGVVFSDLVSDRNTSPTFFSQERRLLSLCQAMDRLNEQFGMHSVYFAGMYGANEHTPTRIAFNRLPEDDSPNEKSFNLSVPQAVS